MSGYGRACELFLCGLQSFGEGGGEGRREGEEREREQRAFLNLVRSVYITLMDWGNQEECQLLRLIDTSTGSHYRKEGETGQG